MCLFFLYRILFPDQKKLITISIIIVIGMTNILVHVGHIYNNNSVLSKLIKNSKSQQEKNKKKIERESAMAISFYTWAIEKYTLEHYDDLKADSNRTAPGINFLDDLVKVDDPYLLGYYYYKTKNFDLAIDYLEQAVDSQYYKAPALYILSVIYREIEEAKRTDSDLSRSTLKLEDAFKYDAEYSSLYIERCIRRLKNKEFSLGLQDFSHALKLNKIHCSHTAFFEQYFDNLPDTSNFLKQFYLIKKNSCSTQRK